MFVIKLAPFFMLPLSTGAKFTQTTSVSWSILIPSSSPPLSSALSEYKIDVLAGSIGTAVGGCWSNIFRAKAKVARNLTLAFMWLKLHSIIYEDMGEVSEVSSTASISCQDETDLDSRLVCTVCTHHCRKFGGRSIAEGTFTKAYI